MWALRPAQASLTGSPNSKTAAGRLEAPEFAGPNEGDPERGSLKDPVTYLTAHELQMGLRERLSNG